MRAWRVGGATAALLIGLSGCAAGSAAGPSPVRSVLEMRHQNVVVQEWDTSCGAAALATILNYQFDDPVSERAIARKLISRKEYVEQPLLVRVRQGFSLLDLQRYVEQRGYRGIGYGQLTLDDLIDLAPIMVPVKLKGYDHFVVFRGLFRDRVLLADPAWGNRTMLVERFEDDWINYPQFGKVGFVVARGDRPAPARRLAPWPGDFLTLG